MDEQIIRSISEMTDQQVNALIAKTFVPPNKQPVDFCNNPGATWQLLLDWSNWRFPGTVSREVNEEGHQVTCILQPISSCKNNPNGFNVYGPPTIEYEQIISVHVNFGQALARLMVMVVVWHKNTFQYWHEQGLSLVEIFNLIGPISPSDTIITSDGKTYIWNCVHKHMEPHMERPINEINIAEL